MRTVSFASLILCTLFLLLDVQVASTTPLPPKSLCLDRAKNASTSPKSSGLWICIEKVALNFDVSNITSFGWAKKGVLRTDPGVHLSSKKAEVHYCSVNLTMAGESGRSAISRPLFLQVWSFTNKTRLEVGPLEVCWAQSGLRSPWGLLLGLPGDWDFGTTEGLTWDRWQFPKYGIVQLDLTPNVKYQSISITQTIIKSTMLSRTLTVVPTKGRSSFQLHRTLILLSSLVSNKGYGKIKNTAGRRR